MSGYLCSITKVTMMMTPFQKFKNLHTSEKFFLLGNVWNVQSALVYEKMGLKALGTSSYAVAHSLGYEDGENMPFDEYLYIIKRIKASTQIPLSVDLEAGYGETSESIVNNIQALHKIGVAGINIEDSSVSANERKIKDPKEFALQLEQISNELSNRGIEMFLNVRCDSFIMNLPDALSEAMLRIKLYEQAQIDGLFIPCITREEDIESIAKATELPLNVLCVPGLPNFERLQLLGVKRISTGNFVNSKIYTDMEHIAGKMIADQDCNLLF